MCVNMRQKPQKKCRVDKINICACARYALRKEHMEGICMFVINGKGFLGLLPGFCVIIFAYVVSVSFGVRDSRNEAQFACQKNYFEPP